MKPILLPFYCFSLFINQQLFAGETFRSLENEVQTLLSASVKSIVTVSGSFTHEIPAKDDGGFLSFFTRDPQKQSVAYENVGTGIIIDTDGHVLTRSSVVFGAELINITMSNGRQETAYLVADDLESGFSLIKMEVSDLQPARYGDSDDIRLGSWNLMIGNSLGVFPSVVFGSINGITEAGLIHITANLNPGNNGSPLINMEGEVVGLVVGRIRTENSTGVSNIATAGIAYPINWIKKIADDMVTYKEVHKGWLGVLGMDDGEMTSIGEIKDNSPAQAAGLQNGDVILSFNQHQVKSLSELAQLVKYTHPGQEVVVEYARDGATAETRVVLGRKSETIVDESQRPEDAPITLQENGVDQVDREELLEKRIRLLEQEIRELRRLFEAR